MARFNPLPPAGFNSIIRLTLKLLTLGTYQEVVLDYQWSVGSTTPTPADLAAFETAWEAATNTKMLACLSPQTDYAEISVAEIFAGVTPTLVLPFSAGTTGTAGATSLPLEMAAVMQKKTALKGQHGRGRLSMPAVPNTFTTPATDGNKINATGTTAYVALMNQLITPVVAGGNNWSLVVAVRPTPPDTLTQLCSVVNLMTLNPILGTTRTRKPGRGI